MKNNRFIAPKQGNREYGKSCCIYAVYNNLMNINSVQNLYN